MCWTIDAKDPTVPTVGIKTGPKVGIVPGRIATIDGTRPESNRTGGHNMTRMVALDPRIPLAIEHSKAPPKTKPLGRMLASVVG